MNLAELGSVICQEFDQREFELNALHKDINSKVHRDQIELVQQWDTDRKNQLTARRQLLIDVVNILGNYRVERTTMKEGLKTYFAAQTGEIKTWVNEQRDDLKGWYNAGNYLLRKSKGK